MVTSREDFLMQILQCGALDLKLIDDVGYDFCDILELDSTFQFDINFVMARVFEYGFSQIENAIDQRKNCLTDTRDEYGISDEQNAELEALEKLEPFEDFGTYHNYIDTHVWCANNKEIYKKYLSEALDDFAEGTGFEISFD